MAALTAIRYNPIMKSFAEKLRQKGKPAKVVITAVMRKLIVTLNAMLRTGEPCESRANRLIAKTVDNALAFPG